MPNRWRLEDESSIRVTAGDTITTPGVDLPRRWRRGDTRARDNRSSLPFRADADWAPHELVHTMLGSRGGDVANEISQAGTLSEAGHAERHCGHAD